MPRSSRYYHRSLNPKKLIETGFSRLPPRMTMARTIKLYKLPDQPVTPGEGPKGGGPGYVVPAWLAAHESLGCLRHTGFRELRESDLPEVHKLLSGYLQKFALAPTFTDEELRHWLLPKGRDGVVYAFVVERQGAVTDMASFYSLPSQILNHEVHKELCAAYQFYTVASGTKLLDLMTDVLIQARNLGFDVFNCLDILDNKQIVSDLKFGIGDGNLQYYLYNYRVSGGEGRPAPLDPQDIGLVMM